VFNLAERIKKIAIFLVFCFNIASKGKSNFLLSNSWSKFLIHLTRFEMENKSKSATLQKPECDDSLIWDIFLSAYKYPALVAADRLGLFASLEHEARSLEQISKLGLGLRAIEALVTTLTSMKLLKEEAGLYSLTTVARTYLLPRNSFYWGHMFHFDEDKPVTPLDLLEALRRESPRPYSNSDLWSNHEVNAEHALNFTKAMHSQSFPSAVGLADKHDFSHVSRLLDVGGGSGCFSIALALYWQNLQCTVAERPLICEISKNYISDFGLSNRIETVAFDMFNDAWPTGFDAIFLSNILHDWNDEKCLHLLRNAFFSLPKGGKLFIHEMLLDDKKNGPWPTTAFSLTMLRFTEGKQFSLSELTELLLRSGFRDIEKKQGSAFYSLIVATKFQ